MPIAGMFLMVWPLLPQHASFAIDGVEVIGSAITSGAVGIVLASHILHDRGTRL
ncbi:hypothetical protein R1A27_34675 (plasmid) [Methylobacterium sp. NMS12]|uniref:hypothetical protein n=1 Tax=Methylobacterium sp. NMS12 TaxID=3079766 RepID=UPI003F883C1F